jgi:DNA repair photolyase
MEDVAKLIGIARLAAEGVLLHEKRRVEYRSLPSRKWLNRCDSDRVPFHWTINPYRGCEYGCKYCYARFTHEFLERRDPVAFETEIYAKVWDAPAFRRELHSVKPGEVIGIGTATDPYQPAERTHGLTRQVLDSMRLMRGAAIYITTKSDLVARDTDLLKTLSEHNQVRVTLTVTTMNRKLARLTEPYAPRPDLRIAAVRKLAEAGVSVGVIASPVLPMITDSEKNLTAVAQAAHDAGADQFGANVLFLMPSAQRVFFPFVAQEFPELLKRYERSYAEGAYLRGTYTERIRDMVRDIRQKVGLRERHRSVADVFANRESASQSTQMQPQLALF